MECQIAAFDKYRTALESQLVQRANDLKKISDLIKKNEEEKPAPGKIGSRCEKALSNGTWRPARGENTCESPNKGADDEIAVCCAAARVWMDAGAGPASENAAWRIIETCQAVPESGVGTFNYQPPRPPMATEMPDTVAYPYVCIEGAKQLAAAATALATAVYMLA